MNSNVTPDNEKIDYVTKVKAENAAIYFLYRNYPMPRAQIVREQHIETLNRRLGASQTLESLSYEIFVQKRLTAGYHEDIAEMIGGYCDAYYNKCVQEIKQSSRFDISFLRSAQTRGR